MKKITQLLLMLATLTTAPCSQAQDTSYTFDDLNKILHENVENNPSFLPAIIGTRQVNDLGLAKSLLDGIAGDSNFRAITSDWLLLQKFSSQTELLKKWINRHGPVVASSIWLLEKNDVILLHKIRSPIGLINKSACSSAKNEEEITNIIKIEFAKINEAEISILKEHLIKTYLKANSMSREEQEKNQPLVPVIMAILKNEIKAWPTGEQAQITQAFSYIPNRSNEFKDVCEFEWTASNFIMNPKKCWYGNFYEKFDWHFHKLKYFKYRSSPWEKLNTKIE